MKTGYFELEKGKLRLFMNVGVLPRMEEVEKMQDLIKKSEIIVVPQRKLSLKQMKTLWVLFTEYGFYTGYTKEETKDQLIQEFCRRKDIPLFSISPLKNDSCDGDIANELITFTLTHALDNGYYIAIRDEEGKVDTGSIPDLYTFTMKNLLEKKCVICGAEADLHHTPALGIGYEHDNGMITKFLPLCRTHHSEAHTRGLKEFEELYHLEPVKMSYNLLIYLTAKSVYPAHFQKFRAENREEIKNARKIIKKIDKNK